ncbi:MAG: hypothetical protein AMXMBFR83_18710 [Phycisphaerae bacterium]
MRLLGMTWDHARGHGPMAATASAYARAHPQVEIAWEKRSLQAFADQPLEELAAGYDLLVIDHPHVGAAARRGCLRALDDWGRDTELRALARASLAGSHESYRYAGRQWALAIDAAAQVACYRPDLIAAPPTTWEQLLELARAGRVLCPLMPVDALMTFFTLAANRGTPCRNDGRADAPLLPPDAGLAVLDTMRTLTQHLPAECLSMNPIETYERLGEPDHRRFACCPLGYGYSNYARAGFRARRLRFGDIPSFFPGAAPRGSTPGGTGNAVSSRSRHLETAADNPPMPPPGATSAATPSRSTSSATPGARWTDPGSARVTTAT